MGPPGSASPTIAVLSSRGYWRGGNPPVSPFLATEAYGPPSTERIPRSKRHSPGFSDLTITLGRKLTPKQSYARTHTQQNLPAGTHAYLRVQVHMLTLSPGQMHVETQSPAQMQVHTSECAQHHTHNQSPPTLRLVCIYTHPRTNTIHVPARPHEEVKQWNNKIKPCMSRSQNEKVDEQEFMHVSVEM